MYKPNNLEILMNFNLLNVDLPVKGQIEKVVDMELLTLKPSQSQPQKGAPIRMQIQVLEALIEDLTSALQRAKGTYVAPADSTKH